MTSRPRTKRYFDQGLRLVCLRVVDGKFTGVWHPGSGAQWWVTGLSYPDFKAKDKAHFDQGLRLYDIEIHNGLFTGVWRPGTGAQWWYFGDDYEMLVGHDRRYFDTGLRLVEVFPYAGACDSACLNQVVMPTGTYNYGITGDPDVYHWPCYTNDGSIRVARISAPVLRRRHIHAALQRHISQTGRALALQPRKLASRHRFQPRR